MIPPLRAKFKAINQPNRCAVKTKLGQLIGLSTNIFFKLRVAYARLLWLTETPIY